MAVSAHRSPARSPNRQGTVNAFFASRLTDPGPFDWDELINDYIAYACDAATLDTADWPGSTAGLRSDEGSRTLIHFTKRLFNYYFRTDLYGPQRHRDFLVLSSGSMHEPTFGLVPSMKRCLEIALSRDWYGYSDSRGRVNARMAVAQLENERLGIQHYTEDSVAITLGGTFAVSCIVDYLSMTVPGGGAICAIPNYPPLVESIAHKMPVRLVNTAPADGFTSIDEVIAAVTPDTRVVLVQTVTNPTGLPVAEPALERLIGSLGPETYLILDEAHECLGEPRPLTALRSHPRVIRVSSLSKQLSVPGMKVGWLLAAREFVDDFYEYASTVYGGPASFFYTLVDVYASFEYLRHSTALGAERDGLRGIAERYGMSVGEAAEWYDSYRAEQELRYQKFLAQRDYTVDTLRSSGFEVLRPRYSVNCAVGSIDHHSSYGFFRRALDEVGVSVYPSILAFDLSDTTVRVTVGRDSTELKTALDRLTRLDAGSRR